MSDDFAMCSTRRELAEGDWGTGKRNNRKETSGEWRSAVLGPFQWSIMVSPY